tara:strand:+ start:33 stop:395 length:363 start_codon:yes stop_codon:yes gene_type:complete
MKEELQPMKTQIATSLTKIEQLLFDAIHEHRKMVSAIKRIHHPSIEDCLGKMEKDTPALLTDILSENQPRDYTALIDIEHTSYEFCANRVDGIGAQVTNALRETRQWKGIWSSKFGEDNG